MRSQSIIMLIAIGLLSACSSLNSKPSITMVSPPDFSFTANPTPQRVEITAYVTGWVEAPADILIDQSNPATPDNLREASWVPSIAYAVQHPIHGVVILDTGLQSGPCDYGFRPIYWVPCRNVEGEDLVSQLKQDGITPDDIQLIIPSHLHGDHISGLKGLLDFADADIVLTESSIREIRSRITFTKGIPAAMIPSQMNIGLLADIPISDELAIPSYDIFGDGSLLVFQTPGHTDGHVSAVARIEGHDVLLTFDAAHLEANYSLGIPSGAVSSSEEAIESILGLNELSDTLEDPIIIFGHEPNQWRCRGAATDLRERTVSTCLEGP